MRIALLIILVLHGLIHLMGFVKAFSLASVSALEMNIDKRWGLLWLAVAVSFMVSAILWWKGVTSWWVWATIAAFVSQILILRFWHDAKFGTALNLLIFLTGAIYYFRYDFHQITEQRIEEIVVKQVDEKAEPIEMKDMEQLPPIVGRWMQQSGVVGQRPIDRVRIQQSYRLKLKPEQEEWYTGKAKQVSMTSDPAFIWDLDMNMMPMVFVTGRDEFYKGKGGMKMKAMALFSVVDTEDNPKVNQGALQRFLAETVWYPSFALNQNLKWSSEDEKTVTATMESGGTVGSCTFYFGENGLPELVTAMRYRGVEADAVLTEWRVVPSDYRRAEGYTIPYAASISWRLDDGDWTWAQLEIIDYSVEH